MTCQTFHQESGEMKFAVAIFTKNEAANIEECIKSISDVGDVFVIDSQSTDNTCEIAESMGAQVIQFYWSGDYPRKKQWTLQQLSVYSKVVMFDADLRGTPQLICELKEKVTQDISAALSSIEYYFMKKKIKFGIKVNYFGVLDPKLTTYPDVEPKSMGYGDIEFHYQPKIQGKIIKLRSNVIHSDNDPLHSWVERHLKYAKYQAKLEDYPKHRTQMEKFKTLKGRILAVLPFKASLRFLISFVIFGGFLDGVNGFRYQWLLSHHYYLTHLFMKDDLI